MGRRHVLFQLRPGHGGLLWGVLLPLYPRRYPDILGCGRRVSWPPISVPRGVGQAETDTFLQLFAETQLNWCRIRLFLVHG